MVVSRRRRRKGVGICFIIGMIDYILFDFGFVLDMGVVGMKIKNEMIFY